MIDGLLDGGWVLLPLALCSVLAGGIVINRFWSLSENKVMPPELQAVLAARENLAAVLRERRYPSSLHNIAVTIVAQAHTPPELIKTALEDALISEVHSMERFLTTLGTIASISPLLGLLGTVFGMIDVFQTLNQAASRDPSIFSGGIGEALVTTAVGLCIAIPSLIFHRHFQRRVEEYSQQLEQEGRLLIGAITTNAGQR